MPFCFKLVYGVEMNDFNFFSKKIKLLGDSITHGVGGSGFEQNGEVIVNEFSRNPYGFCWAKLFKEYMEKNYNAKVVNNGCTGTTIEFIIEHFEVLVDDDDDLILCTIGTNNRHQNKDIETKPDRKDFAEKFYNNIKKLNDLFALNNKTVIFIANIPASTQNEQDKDTLWRILHMNDINDIYKYASEKAGFAFISMYDLMTSYIQERNIEIDQLLCDGLHPNDEGYAVMFELLRQALGV